MRIEGKSSMFVLLFLTERMDVQRGKRNRDVTLRILTDATLEEEFV